MRRRKVSRPLRNTQALNAAEVGQRPQKTNHFLLVVRGARATTPPAATLAINILGRDVNDDIGAQLQRLSAAAGSAKAKLSTASNAP